MSTITDVDSDSGIDRELLRVDPMEVCISDHNERKTVTIPSEFEESIRKKGVLEPPLVRECSHEKKSQGYKYEVMAGQRRTIAAQNVGLGWMDVVLCDYSDADALEASIIENMDEFREEVRHKERAKAVYQLKQMRSCTQRELADQLDVSSGTVSTWIELMRDAWEGTSIHATSDDKFSIDSVSQEVFTVVRKQTGGGKDGEMALSVIVNENLSVKDVREARKRSQQDTPHTFLDQLEMIGAERRREREYDNQERVRVTPTFVGEVAEQLREQATEENCSVQEYVESVIKDDVTDGGYFGP